MTDYKLYPNLPPSAPPEAIGPRSAENPQVVYHLSIIQAKQRGLKNKEQMFKGQVRSKNKLHWNERARKMQNNEPSLFSMRQMVLEISHFKVWNLSKMDVAILKVSSLIFT